MATFLSFSSYSSLLSYLNLILIGAIVFFSMNRFYYLMNVIVYAIAKTFIPIITSLFFGNLIGIGTNFSFGLGTILILLILFFILGLLVIKITEKITDYFSSDTIIYFIIAFGIIESIASWLFFLFISLFL